MRLLRNDIINLTYERGAASLVTAVVLIIASTIIAFMSAQLVLNATRQNANEYRTNQAFEAATTAIETGLDSYAIEGLIDLTLLPTAMPGNTACNSTVVSTASISNSVLPNTSAVYFFANDGALDRCGADGATDSGTLYGMGWSDDCEATRTISVCIGTAPLLDPDNSPEQPFITRAGVGVLGNSRIINRYTNISLWAGESAQISGNAFETYLRPTAIDLEDLSLAERIDDDDANNTQLVSNKNSGFGLDVVLGDESLRNSSGDDLFNAFFNGTKNDVYDTSVSAGRNLDAGASVPVNTGSDVVSGQYWIGDDGSPSTTETVINANTEIGSADDTVVLIVNGDLRINGGVTITGLVYVTGTLTIVGNPKIVGTVISENGPNAGGGTLSLVYAPFGEGGISPPNAAFSGSVVPGSWRDW